MAWYRKPDGGVSPGRHKGGLYLLHVTHNKSTGSDMIVFSAGQCYLDRGLWGRKTGQIGRVPDIDLNPKYKGYEHLVKNFGGCFVVCLNVAYQGGHFQLSGGPCVCAALPSARVGYDDKSVEDRESATLFGMAWPISGSVGLRAGTDPSMIGSDWEADATVAEVEGVPLSSQAGIGWGVNFEFADWCWSACTPHFKEKVSGSDIKLFWN